MSTLFFYLEGAAVFLIILIVLVAAHEYGHYLFARLFGMGVEEFSIGMFGKKPLVSWYRRTYRIPVAPHEDPFRASAGAGVSFEGGAASTEPPELIETPAGRQLQETTVFTVRPWPIGGFVRIKGMMPEEDGGEVHIPGGFYSKPPWQRLIVLFAGPVFSVLSGVLAIACLYMIVGVQRPSNVPIISDVAIGKTAYEAGLRPGDRIVGLEGQPISTFYQLIEVVRDSAGKPLHLTYERMGVRKTTVVTPYLQEEPMPILGPDLLPTGERRLQAIIGILRQNPGHFERLGPIAAVGEAFHMPIAGLQNLWDLAKHPSTFRDSMGGPGTMLKATSEAAQAGLAPIVETAALISISVGIMNLLPIFPLDGGQIVVALAEMLRRGKRLSIKVQNLVGSVGLGFVLLLMVFALTADYSHLTQKDPAASPIGPTVNSTAAKANADHPGKPASKP